MACYNRAITVFFPTATSSRWTTLSRPYARATSSSRVRSTGTVVLGVEKKSAPKSYRLIVEDPVIIEYIAGLRQKYTQSGGVCPFGLSTLIVGFDPYTEKPALYQIDPHRVPSLLERPTPREGTPSLCMSF
uniref:Uncharacterized protein n=1 Tax=Zea mays TaxID=4577 RepID=A0A804U6N0_MAIZE